MPTAALDMAPDWHQVGIKRDRRDPTPFSVFAFYLQIEAK